ncbi:MAG: hypothetical protein WBY94_23545, partial [Polyangiaceae bacterium]
MPGPNDAIKPKVTSVVYQGQQGPVVTAEEIIPFREEIYSAEMLSNDDGTADPKKISMSLMKMQRHVAETSKGSRSIPPL